MFNKIFKYIKLFITIFILFIFIDLIAALNYSVLSPYFLFTKYHKNDCSKLEYIELNKEELIVNNRNIREGFASCIIDKLKNKKRLILNFNIGGLTNEAILLGYFIKENNIEVLPLSVCASSCATIFFSSNTGLYCDSTEIMIHQSSLEAYNILKPLAYIMDIHEKNIFKLNNQNFNYHYYKEIIDKTPFEKVYILNEEEMLKNNFIKNKIDCSIYYNY